MSLTLAFSLDRSRCKKCGICIALCPHKLLAENGSGFPYIVSRTACSACGVCETHCPDFAIRMEPDRA